MAHAIEFKSVTKIYGSSRGISNVSLQVQKGAVYGFLGPNGAGKSTAIHMMVGFTRPTKGSIRVLGFDAVRHSLEIHKKIGFLPSDFMLDKGLTGYQQLEYFGNLRRNYDKQYIDELAQRLNCDLTKKFKHLSRGNKQKVGLISALMHKPDVLILDEPTSGLDPLIQAEFNKIILEQKAQGVTTFISSHVLSEVQEICDHVAFIREGKIVASERMDAILSGTSRQIVVDGISKSNAMKLVTKLKITDWNLAGELLTFAYGGDINALIKLLALVRINNVSISEGDLERIFMNYYEAQNA